MEHLSRPVDLGPVRLRNRVVAAPMERNYCDARGMLSSRYIDHLTRIAAGGSAMVCTEASFVRADGRTRVRQMAVDDDVAVPGLAMLADRVHEQGAILGVQLVHGGRIAKAAVSGFQSVAPSPIPCTVIDGDMPVELDGDDIADLVASFGAAADRCRRAGVDVLSIHAAHGYLISQFMSPRTNTRTDEYGDPSQFLAEVIEAVRGAAPGLAVGLRISAFEGVDGGLDTAATTEIARRGGAADLDFLDVSAGCYEAGLWITQPAEYEPGVLAPYAAQFRKLGPPVGVAGLIRDGATAERILAEGQADFVSVARALHADPNWTNNVLSGRAPRPCISCNWCSDTLRQQEPAPCAVNADVTLGKQTDVLITTTPRRVLVVGAGPAGLEVARRLATAGQQVRLVDGRGEIGGALRLASTLHEYPHYSEILTWYGKQIEHLGVNLVLNQTLSAHDIAAYDPADAIVVATGLDGHIPNIPGIEAARVREIRAWLADGTAGQSPGQNYLIWGADREAVAVADHLAAHGAGVTIVGAADELAGDVGSRARALPVSRLQTSPHVTIHLRSTVLSISADTVRIGPVREAAGAPHTAGSSVQRIKELPAPDQILISQGLRGHAPLLRELRTLEHNRLIYAIGDAGGVGGWAGEAIADAARCATTLLNAPTSAPTTATR